ASTRAAVVSRHRRVAGFGDARRAALVLGACRTPRRRAPRPLADRGAPSAAPRPPALVAPATLPAAARRGLPPLPIRDAVRDRARRPARPARPGDLPPVVSSSGVTRRNRGGTRNESTARSARPHRASPARR